MCNNLLHYRHSFNTDCITLCNYTHFVLFVLCLGEVAVSGCRLPSVLHPSYATSIQPNIIGFGWLVLWCESVRFFYLPFTLNKISSRNQLIWTQFSSDHAGAFFFCHALFASWAVVASGASTLVAKQAKSFKLGRSKILSVSN